MDFSSINDRIVRKYLEDKYKASEEAQPSINYNNNMANAGDLINSFGQAYVQPAVMENSMQNLGKSPDIVKPNVPQIDTRGLKEQAQLKLKQAQSDEDNAVKMAFENRKMELANEVAKKKAEQEQADRDRRNNYQDAMLGIQNKRLEAEIEKSKQPKQTPAQAKQAQTDKEVQYRVNSINSALDRLEENVKNNGTFEMFGPASSDMDSDLYNVALDYAKLVDPDSVAREGEVAAAQKYMLPIKGLWVKNSTAKDIIKQMKDKVAKRAADMKNQAEAVGNGKPQAPHGDRVEQDGKIYQWDGSQYVEVK